MIETQITTIISCDLCDAQVEIDMDPDVEDSRRPDLDSLEARAWSKCRSVEGWQLIGDGHIEHICEYCAG